MYRESYGSSTLLFAIQLPRCRGLSTGLAPDVPRVCRSESYVDEYQKWPRVRLIEAVRKRGAVFGF